MTTKGVVMKKYEVMFNKESGYPNVQIDADKYIAYDNGSLVFRRRRWLIFSYTFLEFSAFFSIRLLKKEQQ